MEKTVNTEAKVILQSSSSTRNMDTRCPQMIKPAKKEEKDFNRKNKSTDFTLADTSSGKQISSTQQAFSVHPKKDYYRDPWYRRGRGQDLPATGVNAIPKKEDDLSQVEYFYYRKKGHFANRCPQKKKQESKN